MDSEPKIERDLRDLREELAGVKTTLGTLISWMVQSANSPIRQDEAATLLKKLR